MDNCNLCNSQESLIEYHVLPQANDNVVMLCTICHGQLASPDTIEINHWHCLTRSMWSEHAAVQVLAWRILNHLSTESWAQDLLSQLYLTENTLKWAQEGASQNNRKLQKTLDSNGTALNEGDSVTLIKDLEVKGAGFTAKRGTLVRKISLTDDFENIEGKVNGALIVLKTKFLKKA